MFFPLHLIRVNRQGCLRTVEKSGRYFARCFGFEYDRAAKYAKELL